MYVRIISSVVGLPILVVLVYLGGIYLNLGVLALSLIGMYEFYKAADGRILPVHIVGFALAVIYTFSLYLKQDEEFFKNVLIGFVPLVLTVQLFFNNRVNINNVCSTFFGFFYVAFMFANVYLIRESYLGRWTVWLVFIAAFCCDTGAYFTGMIFGKHKMAPVLSPKKTIEGAVGGVAAAGIFATGYGFIINKFANVPKDIDVIFICAVTGVLGAVLAEIGDLAASSIKRYKGIKDYGNIMPGHGGVLDRFDSVIFTSAVVYLIVRFLIKT